MKTVVEKAYAKINLWLEVLGKRPDGYHELRSVMQTVSLCDTVTLYKDGTKPGMTCSDPTLSCGEDNLCLRALHAFCRAAGREERVFLHLDKKIPRQAGLGGGSADAAAVLRGLNRLYGEPLSVEELCSVGKGLGADVPFCVRGGAALAGGIGELLTPFPSLPDCKIVIGQGRERSSTPEAYRRLDETPPAERRDFSAFEEAMRWGNPEEIGAALYNRFEDAVSGYQEVRSLLLEGGALGARMTGSGTAVFGLFSDEEKAALAARTLAERGFSAFLCSPCR